MARILIVDDDPDVVEACRLLLETFGRDDDILPVDDFQEKPINPATLARKVDELLATRVG